MSIRATPQVIFSMQMQAIRQRAKTEDRLVIDDKADRELVSFTQKIMRDKLAAAQQKGRSGWWNPSECSMEHLQNLLHEALAKSDMINIINYAAMINARQAAGD